MHVRFQTFRHNISYKTSKNWAEPDAIMTNLEVARTFDASGMRCPMPILKTKKEIGEVQIGEILKVIATDVGTKKDFPAWSKRTGNEIVDMQEEDEKFIWFIKRVK